MIPGNENLQVKTNGLKGKLRDSTVHITDSIMRFFTFIYLFLFGWFCFFFSNKFGFVSGVDRVARAEDRELNGIRM